MNINQLFDHVKRLPDSPVMPVVFLGHGSPMNALPDNDYYNTWRSLGERLDKPTAILCVSAHWTTGSSTSVSATAHPETIHDFYGFPPDLYAQEYPVSGAPTLAHEIKDDLSQWNIGLDDHYGLDHGSWGVIKPMYPDADVPVFQLSIAMNRESMYHYQLGQALKYLRRKGVLVIGSGNVVHNLRSLRFDGVQHDWAQDFDAFVNDKLMVGDDMALVNWQGLGHAAKLSINSAEHYYPLLYVLGMREPQDVLTQFNDHVMGGAISMRSIILSQ